MIPHLLLRKWLFHQTSTTRWALPVINVVITPISRFLSPQLPMDFRPFIRVITCHSICYNMSLQRLFRFQGEKISCCANLSGKFSVPRGEMWWDLFGSHGWKWGPAKILVNQWVGPSLKLTAGTSTWKMDGCFRPLFPGMYITCWGANWLWVSGSK